VPPGRPMWRANALPHAKAVLHRPDPYPERAGPPRYLRSERQTVLKMPGTGAVLFAVHTWIVPFGALRPDQRAGCPVG
ncbi:MAG: heme-dependent oxidative N-demethylase subunit alpha family protein, partial [Pseudomonadota bacterium]